jgi:hypothetical protein
MWISPKGLNFAFKSISSHGGLDSTRNGSNILTNLNKTFLFDLLEGETIGVYSQNGMHKAIRKLWEKFPLLFLGEFECNLLRHRLLHHTPFLLNEWSSLRLK